ncbi:MAG TPA: hypothetical protein VIL20_28210 [Sandaracinaceae bacterium]
MRRGAAPTGGPRREGSLLLACSLVALAACEEARAPRPSDPSPAVRAEPEPSGCELGEPVTWLERAHARGSLAVAPSDEGALVVLAAGGELAVRELSADGRPRSPARHAPLSVGAILALEPVGAHHVLVARGPCEGSAHCLHALALEGGAPAGPPVTVPLPDPIRTFRRASTGRSVLVAWSTASGHRGLERFALGAELSHVRAALGTEPASEESPVEILGLAADGDRFAVVWRRGPTEDVRSQVFVTSASSHADVHALHHAVALDAVALDGETLDLIATFEYSRPHHLRLRLGADEPEHARAIGRGAPIPAPFAERERAELDADARGLWLRRSDAAGDPVGGRIRVAPGRIESAALARVGGALLVAWQADGEVRGRLVRCP